MDQNSSGNPEVDQHLIWANKKQQQQTKQNSFDQPSRLNEPDNSSRPVLDSQSC